MELYTHRLILRPWALSDAENLYEQAKNPHIGPIAGWPVHINSEHSRTVIKTILSKGETYAVCLKTDNVAIGCIDLKVGTGSHLQLSENEGELGYWLGESFWGQGLMTEACRKLIYHGFEDLNLKKLWCSYFEGNERSRRLQERCGFIYHHTHKDLYWKLMNDIRTEHITVLEPNI